MFIKIFEFLSVVVQSLSCVQFFETPWTAACQVFLSFTISRSLLILLSIELMMPSNHLILCCLLLLMPSVFPSIRVFFNELAPHIRWPKYWSFSFSPSSEWIFRVDFLSVQFSSIQSLSRVWFFATSWIAACLASLSITSSQSSLRLMSIESVMPSSHLILCSPLFLLPPIPPSITVFSNESTLCMRCPKYWSFSFSIIPSKEIPGLISFTMDWLDLLAVQGTLKSLLQHHSSKASVLQRSVNRHLEINFLEEMKTLKVNPRSLSSSVNFSLRLPHVWSSIWGVPAVPCSLVS